MSEEAGAWEIVTQMMSVIPRILIIALVIVFVITPISCYVHNKVETDNLEKFTAMNNAINCVKEYGLDKTKLEGCFNQKKYGLKIGKEIILNKDIYDNYLNDKTKYVHAEGKTVDGIKIDLVFESNE